MRFVFIGIATVDRDIGSLEITLFVICINFQWFFLIAGANEFANQATEKVIFQRELFGRLTDHVFSFQIEHIQCLVVDEKNFTLGIQSDNRLIDTIDNGFQKLFGGKDIGKRTGPIFGEAFCHTIKTVSDFPEFFTVFHIKALFVVMIGYFKNTLFKLQNRLTNGAR